MTNAEILSLQPGRELDELIGKTFGLPFGPFDRYSTEISHAFALVEKFRWQWWRIELRFVRTWTARLFKRGIFMSDAQDADAESAESLPHAICLAALLTRSET